MIGDRKLPQNVVALEPLSQLSLTAESGAKAEGSGVRGRKRKASGKVNRKILWEAANAAERLRTAKIYRASYMNE